MKSMDDYKYYAFISYASEDTKKAARLKKRIERFRLPTFLRENQRDHVRVFMADKEFNEHKVKEGLYKILDQSKYLIVVASPNHAQSWWCNEEVKRFLDTDRESRIIPYIIEGSPCSSNSAVECYVPCLRELSAEDQIAGIDTKIVGEYDAYIRVVTRMLGVEYDAVKVQEDRRRQLQVLWMVIAFLVVLVAGLWVWDYCRIKYQYYADYVIHLGLPEGIIPMDRDDIDKRYEYYRFEYTQRKLRRVVHCDMYGNPSALFVTELQDRYPIQELCYQGSQVVGICWKDKYGRAKVSGTFNDERTRCDIVDAGTGDAFRSQASTTVWSPYQLSVDIDLNSFMPVPKSCIGRYRYEYDSEGYLVKTEYKRDNQNTPVSDQDGVAGMAFELDSLHRVVCVQYLDVDGNVTCNRLGISKREYVFDITGAFLETRCYDLFGRLTMNEMGFAICRNEVDKYGRIIGEWAYDLNRQPCTNSLGYHYLHLDWSKDRWTESFFGVDKQPAYVIYPDGGGGIHRVLHVMDKLGNEVERLYYNADNQPCNDNTGVGRLRMEYNSRHYCTMVLNLDMNGKACFNKFGIQCIRFKFDADGNCICESNTDSIGKKLLNSSKGYAQLRMSYKQGLLIGFSTYNVAGFLQPVPMHGNASMVEIKRNAQNNRVSELLLYGPDGGLLHNSVAIVQYKYDNFGNCNRISMFDAQFQPTTPSNALHSIIEYEYDASGRTTLYKQLYPDSSIVGDMYMTMDYLPNGLRSRIVNRNTQGNLCENADGWAEQRFTYRGALMIETSFYDKNDNLTHSNQQGAAILRYEYDHNQRPNRCRCYDVHREKSFNTNNNSHLACNDYNAFGDITDIRYFGLEDEPVNTKFGFHREHRIYNNDRSLVRQEFCGLNDSLVVNTHPQFKYAYMETKQDSNIYCQKFYDADHEPINNSEGYHKFVRKSNSSTMPAMIAYYDKDEELVCPRSWIQMGYPVAVTKEIYDNYNNCIFHVEYNSDYQMESYCYVINNQNGQPLSSISYAQNCLWPIEQFGNGRVEEWTDMDERRDSIMTIIDSLIYSCQYLYE